MSDRSADEPEAALREAVLDELAGRLAPPALAGSGLTVRGLAAEALTPTLLRAAASLWWSQHASVRSLAGAMAGVVGDHVRGTIQLAEAAHAAANFSPMGEKPAADRG
jgi:hypothetical protein